MDLLSHEFKNHHRIPLLALSTLFILALRQDT